MLYLLGLISLGLRTLGHYREAETLLVESYEKLLAERGAGDDKTRDARRRLATLHKARGRTADAAQYAEN